MPGVSELKLLRDAFFCVNDKLLFFLIIKNRFGAKLQPV